MLKIDSRQHFWQFDAVRDAWITADMVAIRRNFLPGDLQPLLRQHGRDGCVAVQASQSEAETDWLLGLASKHDFIRGAVGWVDLRAESIEEHLAHYAQFEKLKGFRHILQGETNRALMLTPLASEGAIPVIIGRREADNQQAVVTIEAAGGRAWQVAAELAEPNECAVQAVAVHFGRIDGLVNNAGVNDGVGLETGDYASFVQSLHRSVVHYCLMAHHALPELKKSQGAIVNITSKTAETGQGSTSAYAAANGGRNALTREWAVELLKYGIPAQSGGKAARNHRQNSPRNRMTTAEELANTTAFLLSNRSSHTTGQIIHVDGGYVHLDLDLALANA